MSKNVLNVVVDIETASVRSDAAILSIAAVPFNLENLSSPFVEDNSFYCVVNATSCVVAGLHFDEETVKWWSNQNDGIKSSLLCADCLHIGDALRSFANYLEKLRIDFDAELRVWSQGIDFDLPILKYAFKNLCPEINLPWHHKEQRDARTYILTNISRLYGECENPYDKIEPLPNIVSGESHVALYDAHRTAWSVAYVNYLLCQSTSAPATSDTTPK